MLLSRIKSITNPTGSKALPSLLLFALFLLLVPHSWASWSTFKSTGTATGVGYPSCASVSSDHVACAVLTAKSTLMVNEFNGSSWGTWKTLSGTVSSSPSCTADGDGRVFCAATSTAGDLLVTIFSGGSWDTPAEVSGSLYSAPSCAEYKAGEVLCLARNSSGGLAWTLYDEGKWSAFANLTTTATSIPDCTSDHESGVICSVYTIAGETLVNRFSGGGTTNCTYWKPTGQVACFAKATNDGIYVSTYNGEGWSSSHWSSYSALGGVANDNASCTTQASGELVCGAIGTQGNNALFANVYNGSDWSGWDSVGGKGLNSPSCAPLTTGKVLCLVLGTNNQLTSTVGP
jgi:hypothetical protein